MTREEAINKAINIVRYFEANFAKSKEAREDLENIIEALDQEPCEDAISRKELLKAIDTWDKFGCDADTKLVRYQDHYIPYIHYDDVVKCINCMPSVNSQKTGHWILTDDDFVYCSECEDSYYPRPIDASWYYCPHCGAKMVEPQESEEEE